MDTGGLRGVFVPLVTPFDEQGELDIRCLERLAVDVVDAGAAGIVALATTGEASSLDGRERDAVVAVCAEVCRDRGVGLLVGAGTNDTRSTIARHEALADVPGVTASLAVVPYYVRPAETAVVAHFQTVAKRSPVPLVIYNVPYRTGRGLGAEAILELAATDNVVGLKQAVGGVDADTLVVLDNAPSSFAVLAGDDPYLLPVVLMGGSGAIAASANLCTDRFVAMVEHGLAGRVAEGRVESTMLLPLTLALFAEPSPAVIKAVLHAQGRLTTPDVRMPLAGASPQALRDALAVLPSPVHRTRVVDDFAP